MAEKKQHPELRGDRNPLTSRKLKERLTKNRFVPKKNATPRTAPEINLPAGTKPEIPANQPSQPAQPLPGDPVPLR